VLIDEAELPATLARVAGDDAPEAPSEAPVPAGGEA
jgi:hypothetical protein